MKIGKGLAIFKLNWILALLSTFLILVIPHLAKALQPKVLPHSSSSAKALQPKALPHSSSSAEVIIERYISKKQYKNAVAVVNAELSRNPYNVSMLYQKALIDVDIEKNRDALDALNKLLSINPKHLKAIELKIKVIKLLAAEPHNELGLSQDEFYVSDIGGYWSYTSLHYYRFTQYGTYGGRFNYANRYGRGGRQYVLEAYPILTKNIYAELLFGYSNTSERVFPRYQYSIEPYFNLPCGWELSLGFRGIRSFDKNIYTYTGSINYTLGDYVIWFRPYRFTPITTNYFEAGIRRYFSDQNHYLALKVGTGRIPDIGDVPPLNQIIVYNAKFIAADAQFSLSKHVFLRLRAGYTRQDYSTGLLRKITNGGAELIWRF